MAKPAAASVTAITLPPLDIKTMTIALESDSPLICHAWSAKAKQMILDRHMGKAQHKKESKDPQQDFEDSLYPLGKGYGFPATGIKSAAVSACRYAEGVTMTEARGAFHINCELVRLEGTPRIREDMVRIGMGTADIRFRAEFPEWRIEFAIRFNARALSPDQIVNLFNTAGFGVGIGEWRPEKDGSYGMFHVATGDQIKEPPRRGRA